MTTTSKQVFRQNEASYSLNPSSEFLCNLYSIRNGFYLWGKRPPGGMDALLLFMCKIVRQETPEILKGVFQVTPKLKGVSGEGEDCHSTTLR